MMKTIGLDLGDKTLGVAMSDALGMMAHGVTTFTFKRAHYKHALAYVEELVQQEAISTIVLGLPKNMDNTEGERAAISRRFATRLEEATGLKVILWDERLTTVQADRVLISGGIRRENRKDVIDKLAATLILQSYLEQTATTR